MFSAPFSRTSYISDPVIMMSAAALCQVQGLSGTHTVTSVLPHLEFSWSLLDPTISPFVFNPHQLLQSLICYPQSQLSNTSLHPWCDSLTLPLYVSLSLPPSLFSGMLTLPKAKLLHLFHRKHFHIPFFQLLYYLSYFDIKY